MPPVLCPFLLLRRVFPLRQQPCRRLAHSQPQRPRSVSSMETAVGILVIFSAFLTPPAYVLSNLSQFRRR